LRWTDSSLQEAERRMRRVPDEPDREQDVDVLANQHLIQSFTALDKDEPEAVAHEDVVIGQAPQHPWGKQGVRHDVCWVCVAN